MKLLILGNNVEKFSYTKFHENPSGGIPVVSCGQTADEHDESNSRFSQFGEHALKTGLLTTNHYCLLRNSVLGRSMKIIKVCTGHVHLIVRNGHLPVAQRNICNVYPQGTEEI